MVEPRILRNAALERLLQSVRGVLDCSIEDETRLKQGLHAALAAFEHQEKKAKEALSRWEEREQKRDLEDFRSKGIDPHPLLWPPEPEILPSPATMDTEETT